MVASTVVGPLLTTVLQEVRRLQMMSANQCNPAAFSAEAAAIDAACCDGSNDNCHGGIPDNCDAKCAVVYNRVFDRCERFLRTTTENMNGHERLFSTCTVSLPTEPLLRALVLCSANPIDPSFGVDCGQHGSCTAGRELPLCQ